MKKQLLNQCLAVITGLAILSAGTARAADQTKADNNNPLEQGTSWVSGTFNSGDGVIWDSTVATAANCSNTVATTGASDWSRMKIVNPAAPVYISTGGSVNSYWRRLDNSPAIDMGSATTDLTIGPGFTVQTFYASTAPAIITNTSHTLTISGQFALGRSSTWNSMELDGDGNTVFSGSLGGNNYGTLIKNGNGFLTVSVVDYAWTNMVLNAGTFNINQNYAFSGYTGSALTIAGGTLDATVNGISLGNAPALNLNGDFSFNGTYSLNLGSGAVVLGGNRQVTCSANTLTVGGAIGDGGHTYSLTKAGAGNLTLTGANTYSGNTTVSAGTLALSGSGSLSNSPNFTIASGATLDVSGLTTALALGSGQTLNATATGANTTGTIKGGSSKGLTLSVGGIVFTAFGGGGTAPLTASGAAGAVNLNGAPVTVTTTTALTANTYTLIDTASSGTVTGTPGTLTVNGSGLGANTIASLAVTSGKLVLTVTATLQVKADNNNYLNNGSSWVSGAAPSSSQWAVWNSTVATPANCTNALGGNVTWGGIQISNPSVAVNITNGSTLTLNGVGGVGIDMSSASVDLTLGSGVANTMLTIASNQLFSVASGRNLFISNDSSVGNNITETITNGGNVVISGRIFGGTGTNVVMSGTGALTLSGPNYLKNFVLNSGTLNVNHNFALCGNAAQALTINGGTLDATVNGISQGQAPALNLNGDFVFNGTYSLNYGTGAVTLGGNRQVTVNANTLTVGGAIGDGGLVYSLTKAGAGKLTLTAANTYTGNTTISAGTLALSGSGSIASSNLTVASGATLDVSGLTTALALGSGQTLNAGATGTNTTGTITMGSSKGLTLSAGGLVFTGYGGGLTAPLTAGTAGSLNLNGAPITVTTTSTLSVGYYTLIAPGGGSVTGSPGTLTVNGSGTAQTATVSVQYGALILTVGPLGPLPGIVKADNAIALNQSSSWLLGIAPGGSDWAAWSGTYAATNLTNAIQNYVTWGGILISSNVAPTGVPITITNYNNTYSLFLNGIGGVAIDMSAASDDLVLGSYRVYIQNNSAFNVGSGRTLTVLNNLQLQNYTLTLNGAGNYKLGAFYGVNPTSLATLIMSGSGAVTLTGPGYYLTNTTLNSGTLNLNYNTAISGFAGYGLTINGGTLDNTSGAALTVANSPTYQWNGDFAFAGTTNLGLGGGAVTLGGNRQVTVSGNTLTVGGAIGDGGSGYSLTKAGSGTLTLSGANTYTGNTTVSGGTLEIAQATLATNSTVNVASGAMLKLDFAVTNAVTDLTLGGVPQPAGVYNAISSSGYISGIGSLQVTAGAASTNAQLANLVISNGAGALIFFPSAFTTNNLGIYYATNAYGAGSVTVLVTNVDGTASNTLLLGTTPQQPLTNGLASASLTLVVGTTNVTVQVVSQDLSVTNSYVVALTQLGSPVSSDASLSYLSVTPGTLSPVFATGTTNYAVTNAYAGTSVTVTVTNTSSYATNVLYLNGVAQATNAYTLTVASLPVGVGSTNVIVVMVTAQDGVTTSTNTVTMTRLGSTNALLSNLSLSPGTLSQTFNSGTTSYTATNTYPTNGVTVTATSADGTAALALSFNTGSSYNISLTNGVASVTNTMSLASPANVLAVQVVSQDLSQTNVYTVNVLLQPSATVPKLTNSVSGNNLVLSWPADHLGYRLLVQTNNLNKGVSGNSADWGTVPGTASIIQTNIAIIKTGVTNEYYKLVYP